MALPRSSQSSPESTNASGLRVNLTIQEAIYTGIAGFARSQEPVTVGVPLADAVGIKNVSQLGLAGASAGQFRVLGRWPSGNIEWVLVDTLADVAAGKTSDSISLINGSGNFGGPNLALEDASKITVATGTAKFVIRKKNFNLIDEAAVSDRVLIRPGTSGGLVLAGPSPGNTVCPCSTTYASSNDEASAAVVEENGPVRATIRATGQLKDSAGHAYMRYTVRLHFYKGKTKTKAVVSLQNADYGPSDSFASAYKGFRSFEARFTPNLGEKKNFRFSAAHSDLAGSFTGTENAYVYQAYSDHMEHPHWASPDTRSNYAPRSYIRRIPAGEKSPRRKWRYSQEGCLSVHGNEESATARKSDSCAGWADLSDGSGAGIEIGTYEIAAYWPKSLEFANGGSEVRIGIWPDQTMFGQGAQDYYQAWPQYSIHTIYLDFHDGALPDPNREFGRLQYPLIARAPASYYNDTKALLYPLPDAKREDDYFKSLAVACCIRDLPSPKVYRTYNWRAPGAGNQAEMRWANLMLWLQRWHVGRYIDASHFYQFQAEQVFPRSDFNGNSRFNWRERPESELDPTGLPAGIISSNDNTDCDPGEVKCGRNWIDNAHAHWYGMTDFYFMTGDETIRDAIEDGATDIYGNPNSRVVKNGTYWNPRNVGEALMSDARLALFYKAIGDHRNSDNALLAGVRILRNQVWPELRVSGFGNASQGVNRARGVHYGCCPPVNRFAMPFQEGILGEGLWEFLQAEGPEWPDRQLTFDLAYGIASWSLNEAWRTNGSGKGCRNGSGLAYEIFIDRPNNALDPSCVHTVWFNFYNYAKYSGSPDQWTEKFGKYLQHINGNGVLYGEIGTIFEGAVVGLVLDSEPLRLRSVPFTATELTSGRYRLSWTVPTGVQGYRIKYSDKNIVEWLEFDPVTNQFRVDPATNVPWFAASDLANPPLPAPAGSVQTFDLSYLDPKNKWHFAIKAYIQSKR